jgi:hypothetical protein
MSTTATPAKPKTPPSISDQLAEIDTRRATAHAKVHQARRAVTAYDAETEQARADYSAALRESPEQTTEGVNPKPLPDTDLARVHAEVRARMTEPNPHQGDYEQARDEFCEVADELEQFKRAHVTDRLAELDPARHAAEDEMREGAAIILRGCDRYGEVVNRAREIIIDTPGLNGQALGYDGKPGDWKRMAVEAVESEIAKPGLTPHAAAKVAQ